MPKRTCVRDGDEWIEERAKHSVEGVFKLKRKSVQLQVHLRRSERLIMFRVLSGKCARARSCVRYHPVGKYLCFCENALMYIQIHTQREKDTHRARERRDTTVMNYPGVSSNCECMSANNPGDAMFVQTKSTQNTKIGT